MESKKHENEKRYTINWIRSIGALHELIDI